MDKEDSSLDITIRDLQSWMRDRKQYTPQLAAWEERFVRAYKDWEERKGPIPLKTAEVLAMTFTAHFDTFDRYVDSARRLTTPEIRNQLRATYELARAQAHLADFEAVTRAWARAGDALMRQLSAAERAHAKRRAGPQKPLKEFYAALTEVKRAVKRHSKTPSHRPQKQAARDEKIFRLRRQRKNWAQIANQLEITPKVAERAYSHYRERSQRQLYQWLLILFSQPPE